MLIRKKNNLLFWTVLAAVFIIIFLFLGTGLVSANYDMWEAAYWNNPSLNGPPTVVRMESALDHNWKGLSPDPSINVDNFSARWVRTVHFEPGTYRFKATMDDGMRVWIDKKQIINDWNEGKVRTNEADVMLNGGPHTIVVEYFEKGGVAIAGFTWSQISGSQPPGTGQPPGPGQPMPPAKPEHPIAPPPGKPMPEQPMGIVATSFLNVRQGPNATYSSIAVLPKGTQVILVGRNSTGSWLEVANPGGSKGWVNGAYIMTKFPKSNLPVTSQGQHTSEPRGVVNVPNLNVRFGPGMNFGVFAILHQGQTVAIVGRNFEGTWLKVRIASGAEGWVNAKYINGNYSMQHLPVMG